jgi:hypothetical protein
VAARLIFLGDWWFIEDTSIDFVGRPVPNLVKFPVDSFVDVVRAAESAGCARLMAGTVPYFGFSRDSFELLF